MNIEEKIRKNVKMSEFSTFKIGGEVRYFMKVYTEEELICAYSWAKERGVEVMFFSGGSNILVQDEKIDVLMLRLENDGFVVEGENVRIGGGVGLTSAAVRVSGLGLSGFEWAVGIPGSLGGAIRGNAGAFGGVMSEQIKEVRVFDVEMNNFCNFSKEECEFEYRGSRIKREKGRYIIWSAVLEFVKGDIENIKEKIDEIVKHRIQGQPKLPSAGCIFKNFTIDNIDMVNKRLANMAREKGAVKGGKVGAGWVIDEAGLKGKKIGGAQVSEKHANFIVNFNNAKARDVRRLIDSVKSKVFEKFGLKLEEEVEVITKDTGK